MYLYILFKLSAHVVIKYFIWEFSYFYLHQNFWSEYLILLLFYIFQNCNVFFVLAICILGYSSMLWLIEISVPATTVSTGDFNLLRDEDTPLGVHEVTSKYSFWNTSKGQK